MTILTLRVPDFLEENHIDTIRFIAAKLYESGKLSLGQAAEITSLNKTEFAAMLSDYGVNYINYSYEEVMDDVARITNG